MTRRKKLPPDTRLDWRDPDMPVIRSCNGRVYEFHPDKMTEMYAAKMDDMFYPAPHYKNDPSYNWNKKRL